MDDDDSEDSEDGLALRRDLSMLCCWVDGGHNNRAVDKKCCVGWRDGRVFVDANTAIPTLHLTTAV